MGDIVFVAPEMEVRMAWRYPAGVCRRCGVTINWEFNLGDRVITKIFGKEVECIVVERWLNGHGVRVYDVRADWQRRANEMVRVDTVGERDDLVAVTSCRPTGSSCG